MRPSQTDMNTLRIARLALVSVAALASGCRRAPLARTRDWAPLLRGHTVGDGAPASLRYAVPAGCRLAYEWSFVSRIEPTGELRAAHAPAMGVAVGGRAEGDAASGLWTLSVPWREVGLVTNGTRNPPSRDEDFAAPMLLRTDGRAWREDDGPTQTWSAFGTFAGLVRFFPTLPAESHVGASTPWRYRVHGQNAGAAVEVRRGHVQLPPGAAMPPVDGKDMDARARIARWITVDGQPVAVIETDEVARDATTQQIPGAGSFSTRAERRSTGEHLVLARSGRLLLARYDDDVTVHTDVGGRAMDQRQRGHGELRLVAACDGPTLASPVAPRSGEERALDAAVALRNAVVEGRAGDVVARLSPSLRQRHGDATLAATLLRHVRRHGPRCLGLPEGAMLGITRLPDGAWRVPLSGACEHVAPDDRRTTCDEVMEVDLSADGATVRSVTAACVQGLAPDVLVIDAERVMSDAPDDAPAAP